MDINDFITREEIRDCITRIARGEDRRDGDMLRGAYWPDATIDFGVFSGSFSDYIGWVVPGDPSILDTLHTLGQTYFQIDDDHAKTETHITSYHRIDSGVGGIKDDVMGGRYLDRLERRDGEWRVAARIMIYDWSTMWGDAADWSKGLMGMPFQTANPTGKAQGDASVAFFGG